MRCVPLNRLLQEFKRKGKLLIIVADSRCQPGCEPIVWGKQQGLFETIIGSGFLSRQQTVWPREPNIGRVAAFLDGSIGEQERTLQIAGAAQSNCFSSEQLGFARKTLKRLVGPK